jgi:hypothetical protein
MANVLVSINDLVKTCQLLNEVRVIAAGCTYATLKLSDKKIKELAKSDIQWWFD